MSLSDRRHVPRFPFPSLATLWVSSVDHRVKILNLSLQGARIKPEYQIDLAAGQECWLHVYLGSHRAFVALDSRVVHLGESAIGIQFNDLSETTEKALHCLVEASPGTPQLLDRDVPALLRMR